MTAKLFDINNRDLKLNENLIVEASAGTGKTYTIENLAVRLLIEPDPIPIEQLLIVTFTRAATRDLRLRIRHRILESIRSLETKELPLPDYLSYVIEKGEEELRRALLLLKKALSSIDQAQIFTIHGFCNRALQEFSVESGVTNLQMR